MTLDLFDQPVGLYHGSPGHAKGSDTSRAAAEIVHETLAERQRRVLAVLRTRGPSTGQEIANVLHSATVWEAA